MKLKVFDGFHKLRLDGTVRRDMKNATLRQLKVFETAARHLSFSRAAEELHLTQPAVSAQIKLLQQHAGLALFEQLGKKVYLTPAGTEKLLRYSRAIIELFPARPVRRWPTRQGVSSGTLHVAVISAGDYFFPYLLAEFAAHGAGRSSSTWACSIAKQLLSQQLGDQPHRPGDHGAPAAASSTPAQRGVRAPPLCDRGATPNTPLAHRKRRAGQCAAARTLASHESAALTPGTRWNTVRARN